MGRNPQALLAPLAPVHVCLGRIRQDSEPLDIPYGLFEEGLGPVQVDASCAGFGLPNDLQASTDDLFDHHYRDSLLMPRNAGGASDKFWGFDEDFRQYVCIKGDHAW
jgi:hypothetical protein